MRGQNQGENPQHGKISTILQNKGGETFYSGCAVLQQIICYAVNHRNYTALLFQHSVKPPHPSTYLVSVPQNQWHFVDLEGDVVLKYHL